MICIKNKILENKNNAVCYKYIKTLKVDYYHVDDKKLVKYRRVPLKELCFRLDIDGDIYMFSEIGTQLIYVKIDILILKVNFKRIEYDYNIKKYIDRHLYSEKSIIKRYNGIKQRCYNKNNKSYKWYGAKGVTMCDEWLNNFDSFYNWCIENGFKKELHIDKDRLCDELNIFPHIYSPETCEFTTLEENNKHQSSNYKIKYEGIEYNLSDLSEKLGVNRDTLKIRYEKNIDLLHGITNKVAINRMESEEKYLSIENISATLNTSIKYLRDKLLKDISFIKDGKCYVFLNDLKNKKFKSNYIYEIFK